MGKLVIAANISGGVDCDAATATQEDILSGKTAGVADHDEPVAGTMPNNTGWSSQIGVNGKATIPKGYHDGNGYVNQSIANKGAWTSRIGVNGKAVIPEGYHSGSGYVDQLITNRGAINATLGTNGSYVIPEGYHNGAGKVSASTMAAQQIKPGTAAKTLTCINKYMTGNVTVPAISIPANVIKRGQVITFPDGSKVTGTWEGYVAGNGEIYNWGTIGLGGGFWGVDSVSDQKFTLEYMTTYMLLRKYYETAVITNNSINITPYSKINVIATRNQTYQDCSVRAYFYSSKPNISTMDNSTGNPPVVLRLSLGKTNALEDTTTVLSGDISSVNTTCFIGISFDSATTGPGNEYSRIYKIWLS